SMSVPRRYVQKWAPWSMTPLRNASAWTRLPMSRPCMSVIATISVSIRPSRTIAWSSWSRGWSPPPWWLPWSLCVPVVIECVLVECDVERRRFGTVGARSPCEPVVLGLDDVPGGRLELALQLGQLGFGTLDLRTREARPGVPEVVDQQQDQGPDHERPGDVARGREAEQDHQHEHPEHRDVRHELRPTAEAPDAMRPPFLGCCSEEDHDSIGRVQEDRADRGDDQDRRASSHDEGRDREQPGHDRHACEGVAGGPVLRGHAFKHPGPRDPAAATE